MNLCMFLQGGEDAYDALSLDVISRERALYLVSLLRKETCNLRHPMHLRHPVICVCFYMMCVWGGFDQ